MKKFLSLILAIVIVLSSFSVTAFAQESKTVYTFSYEGNSFSYYKDEQGNPYIIENGIKYPIAVPVIVQKVTDEAQLEQLRSAFNSSKIESNAKSNILFSKTIYFNTLAKTGVLNVTDNYLFLKCSELNPSNAKRGFSYWISYSFDNIVWEQAFYINQSLSSYTRHPMSTFGDAPYVEISIFSYYGTVSSCLLYVKEGGVLG